MPGERLMCVWQAVFARDVFPESGVKKATVKSVTEAMRVIPMITYQEAKFEETFTTPKVDFDLYKTYVEEALRSPRAPRHLVAEKMERACWDIVEEAEVYSSQYLVTEDIMKLWQIFNRVSVKNSYTEKGPMADAEEINWLMEKIAASLGKTWVSASSIPAAGLSFKEFLNTLDRTYFASIKGELLRQCIENTHACLVREVIKVGILSKRTKKQSNWTNWQKRWFVLTPTGLQYFETEACKNLKGQVLIDEKTQVDSLPDFSSFTKTLKCRFHVANRPELEIELTAGSELEKQQWIGNIQTIIESAKSGLTPMGVILKQRTQKKAAHKKEEHEKLEAQFAEKQAIATGASIKMSAAPDVNQNSKPTANASTLGNLKQLSIDLPPPPPALADDVEQYDNNTLELQKDKIKVVFQNIDKDGNGKIDQKEFFSFVSSLGLAMDQKEVNLIFDIVDVDDNGFLCFSEFYDYFIQFVIGQTTSTTESRMRAAFLAADRDGSGMVNFKEFAEFAMSRRRDLAIDRLLTAFDELDKDHSGEISFKEFRTFFNHEARSSISALGAVSPTSSQPQQPAIEDMLRGVYDQTDATELANYLRERWTTYTSFKRAGASGDIVMKGSSDMVNDYVPGEYALIDLACFNDLPSIEPRHVVSKVTWNKSNVPGKSGRLEFDNDFAATLPTVIATNETLSYYGASLADSNQMKVSLLYRHGIQDFTYENNYLDDYVLADDKVGGAGLERHGFSHLDCPMDDDSGFFVMGKLEENGELHITAFKIPTRHTLYVPPFTIHCNDYLRGTWRTMLSDEAEIDHVQLVKRQRQGKLETYEHFQFQFEPLK